MIDNSLAKLDQATRMLAEVRTIDDAKDLIDLAEAARVYAKQVELGLEAQNHAAEIKLRAQRRAGEILDKMEKNKGGRPTDTTDNLLLPVIGSEQEEPPTLTELGITGKDAHVWQTLAKMPELDFEKFIGETTEEGKELTTAGIYRTARLENETANKIQPPPMIGKYRVIYADPPWKYGDPMGIDGYKVSAEMHYPVMSISELCALPVVDMAEDSAVLFLWVTAPLMEDAFRIVSAWGFEYKTHFVWDKIKHNFGHYSSVRHELLFLCTRGSCLPDIPKLFDSVVSIERTDHSCKPEQFREMIDTLYPNGKRIELFARDKHDGWEVWGNEPNIN
jgi:N6-adenosine-specific RNA methylase IME4